MKYTIRYFNGTKDGHKVSAYAIYDMHGNLIKKEAKVSLSEDKNYEEVLHTFEFALNGFKTSITDCTGLVFVTGHKNVADWVITGRCPIEHMDSVERVRNSMSFLPCSVEIIYMKDTRVEKLFDFKKLLGVDLSGNEYSRVSDLF